MTNFLDELERELHDAHPRRKRAARRAAIESSARKAPAAIATVAVLGGATAFVVSTGGDDRATHSGAATTKTSTAGDYIAVLNATGRRGADRPVREFIAPRHGRVVDDEYLAESAPSTTVYYARGRRSAGRALAKELDVRFAPMTATKPSAVTGTPLAIEVGRDVTGGRTVPLKDAAGRQQGTLTTVDRNGRRFIEIQTGVRHDKFDAVWLRGADRAKLLGFVATPVKRKDDTLVVTELPEGDLWPELVLSRESSAKPGDRPAKVLLTAPLEMK
jgi:hypothetical protein